MIPFHHFNIAPLTIDFPFLHQSINPSLACRSGRFVALALLFIFDMELARAQGCCTVGAASLGGVESGVQKHRRLSIGVNYQFNSLTREHRGTVRFDDSLRRTASVRYFTIAAEYGLVPNVSLYASLPFADKAREITFVNTTTRFSETAALQASGIGDLMLLAKYQLITPTIAAPFEFAVGGGASLPTGSFTREQNGAQLSIDLQPGTGTPTLMGWAFAMKSFPADGVRLFASATYRYAGTNLNGYRIGDEYLITLGGDYVLGENFSGSLHLRSRFAMQDYSNRRTLASTGGTYHDLMPSMSYVDGPSYARLFGQLPVYRNVRGTQLTLSYLLGVEYRYTIEFGNSSVIEVP
jgi:hypothetical protein